MTTPAPRSTVTVVGLTADGTPAAGGADVLAAAEVVVGGRRQLALLPPLDAKQVPLPVPLSDGLPALLEEYADARLVVLASGDPMRSGIGSTLVGLLGPDSVRVLPAVSSVALARARLGWPAEEADVETLVGRHPARLRRLLTPGRRVLLLSSDGDTPAIVAELLVDAGFGGSELTVLSDLGTAEERVEAAPAHAWTGRPAPALNVVAVVCRADPAAAWLPATPGLPDDAFEHDGQLTRRDLRASALARLAPAPGHLLWDVGAGAGSVGIEWLRSDPRCRAVAVESHPERAERVRRNAARLGVPSLEVVEGRAPDALAGLPAPDAVFVGGGASAPGVLEACWAALRSGGRLVVHAVTLETEAVLHRWAERHSGELTRIAVERAEPIGGFTGWRPARAVVQWATAKPHDPLSSEEDPT